VPPKDDASIDQRAIEETSPPSDAAVIPAALPPVERYSVSPRSVALLMTVLAIACLATLSIVTGVRGADGLSTIALALAIIAFVVQILVFIAQSQTASQQMVQSEQLNTQSRALLAEMQATARATHAMVNQQFGDLLHAFTEAVSKTTDDSGGDGFDAEAFETRLMENIRGMQAPAAVPATRPSGTTRRPSIAEDARARRAREAAKFTWGPFPDETEAAPVLEDLTSASPDARLRLKDLARDKKVTAQNGDYEGLVASARTADADSYLEGRGLIKLVRLPESSPGAGELVYQLTDRGVLAARVLSGEGPVPEWAHALLLPRRGESSQA
jgi:hypothetical protein